jgi:hypothetical protein
MIICRDKIRLVHPLLSLDGEVIPFSRNVKNLGIIWMWCDQAKVARRNVGFVLSRLWHFAVQLLSVYLSIPYRLYTFF